MFNHKYLKNRYKHRSTTGRPLKARAGKGRAPHRAPHRFPGLLRVQLFTYHVDATLNELGQGLALKQTVLEQRKVNQLGNGGIA